MAKHRSLAKQSRGLGPRNAAKRGRVADRYPYFQAGIAIPILRGICTKIRNF
jgi:hypothetical protein